MYSDIERGLITLCSFEKLGYNVKRTLLSGLTSPTPDFVRYEKFLIKTLPDGVYNKVKDDFYDEGYRAKVFENLQKKGIRCITCFSEDYPEQLRHIPAPPIVLYCLGNAELLKERCFGIVGSRKTNPEILKYCKKLSGEICENFNVVSGCAEGADAAALAGAVQSGKVISVLAYGFDYFYPACNKKIICEVAAKGLLLTEHPPKVKPQAYLFPARNRIIAGLSEGVLTVSAGKRSGAKITAEIAADYGKDVFALPYSVGIPSGEGCNALIKSGAYLAESARDIFDLYGLQSQSRKEIKITDEEKRVLEAIAATGEAFIGNLSETTQIPVYKLTAVLSALEIKGLVVRLGGNRFAAVKN